jgi:protein-tyrosine phosphatase
MNFQTILVICAGNICRSPMAEALLKVALPNKTILSAGIVGLSGHPADPMAVECMAELGIDISKHIGRPLDRHLMLSADIVLTMSTEQVRVVEQQWPFSKGKVFRLCHWSAKDIADPYRYPKDAFVAARHLIIQGVSEWEPKLC